jgi:hypothetical protein
VAGTVVSIVRQLAGSEATILDFGTGSGKLVDLLRTGCAGANLVGVDMSYKSLAQAPRSTEFVLVAPEGPLPFRSGSFDIITSLFAFHFRFPSSIRFELLRVIRDSGFLVGNVYGPDTILYEQDMAGAGWKLCLSGMMNRFSGHRVDVWHSSCVSCPRSWNGCGLRIVLT